VGVDGAVGVHLDDLVGHEPAGEVELVDAHVVMIRRSTVGSAKVRAGAPGRTAAT
jgi:hypothetical protein